MADTFRERVRQAIADPGSITDRKTEVRDDGLPETGVEPLIGWQARAVLMVFSEPRWAPDAAPAGGGGTTAVLVAIWCAVVFGVGVWLGSVWL